MVGLDKGPERPLWAFYMLGGARPPWGSLRGGGGGRSGGLPGGVPLSFFTGAYVPGGNSLHFLFGLPDRLNA